MIRVLLLLGGLVTAGCALARSGADVAPPEQEIWLAVRLDERHVGHMVWRRQAKDGRVETSSDMEISLLRASEALRVRAVESSIETTDGKPLGFSSAFESLGTTSSVEGRRLPDGRFEVFLDAGGRKEQRIIDWPAGALLSEGQRLEHLSSASQAGVARKARVFDPSSLQVLDVETTLIGPATLQLPDGDFETLHVRQKLGRDGGGIQLESWVDRDHGFPRRLRMPALGLMLELEACPKACATADPELADVFRNTVVDAPRPLSARDRRGALEFDIAVRSGPIDALGMIPGQSILSRDADRVRLRVERKGAAASAPDEADSASARWVQSDDPAVRAFVDETLQGIDQPMRRMQALEQAVRRRIAVKSLRIGYASAVEVLQINEGDCTEHAVLLAAAARAAGIPSRVVTGIAYAPEFSGRNDVFVPHAWVIAWVDGAWHGFDAALPRFDATHIGMTAGHGDPFDFYSGAELLGNLSILAVDRAGRASERTR